MKARTFKRPFATYYYTASVSGDPAHQGAAKTEEGAKRSTVVRIILAQYVKAVILDRRGGTVLYTLRRTQGGIAIHYGSR